MPTIYDNVEHRLLDALKERMQEGTRADICVGYFNLRGWRPLLDAVDRWPGGDGGQCRLLIGMQRDPQEELRSLYPLGMRESPIDQQRSIQLKRQIADDFRKQLTVGAPTNQDEATLRALSRQLRTGKLTVRLFLRQSLHAKLYIVHREDSVAPIVSYLGSSNLTFAGLSDQLELNVDVVENDAACKLQTWFEDRWSDRWCLDITKELADIIDESWAREEPVSPYLVYLKMAYHLSQEARSGLDEFRIPRIFGNKLFAFQAAAVQIAARHLNTRGGVLIGDVVGLGKTLMATALAKIFEEDQGTETLIICPVNLQDMWSQYVHDYQLRARILPLSQVQDALKPPEAGGTFPRFRVVLIDESHNLRNPEGARYRAIRDYIERNDSKCILLSATPYNKTYHDLSAQLGLFLSKEEPLGVGPERLLREIGPVEFFQRHQCQPQTLLGFEKSEFADDWRDLMRRYLVRRTRSFIQTNYAQTDDEGRSYLLMQDGTRAWFPKRIPKTVPFEVSEGEDGDPYGRLFAPWILDSIDSLRLPRYGLGNYIDTAAEKKATAADKEALKNLGRAGVRLKGFCRTNLYKRLESSGYSFLLSVERHILRNYVFLHAIENGLPLPIGTQDTQFLDVRFTDEDESGLFANGATNDEEQDPDEAITEVKVRSDAQYRAEARRIYDAYPKAGRKQFRWLKPELFEGDELARDLTADNASLREILDRNGAWDPQHDVKLNALIDLVQKTHGRDKVLLFSQFADTIGYLDEQLRQRGVDRVEAATGAAKDPTELAHRFSPISNGRQEVARAKGELRVLLATDVLSEGQNLQDCSIIVNYDLPWAIIRLIQRAGRVDRIGQQAEEIRCYSFLPADGVEEIIRLRSRVRQRLTENAEVVGSDEAFFEGEEETDSTLFDLYHEKAGILDGEDDSEVDLASQAFQIWKNAIDGKPSVKAAVEALPDVVYAAKAHEPRPGEPGGVLLYARAADGNDALTWVGPDGATVSESQLTVLRAARCESDTPGLPRDEKHHELVRAGVNYLINETTQIGGQLGRRGARVKTYERLTAYLRGLQGNRSLWDPDPDALKRAIDDIYKYPLRDGAKDTLNRLLRTGATDQVLAQRVIELREDDQLSMTEQSDERREPKIICSLGLVAR